MKFIGIGWGPTQARQRLGVRQPSAALADASRKRQRTGALQNLAVVGGSGFMESGGVELVGSSRDRFVKVQQHVADGGPGGEFAHL